MISSVISIESSGIKMKIAKDRTVVMSFSADKIKKDRLTYGVPVDTTWNDKPMEHFDGLEVVFKIDGNGELIEPGMMKYREDDYEVNLEIWSDWCDEVDSCL